MQAERNNIRYVTYAKVRCQKYGSGTTSMMVLNNISEGGARLNLVASTILYSKGDIVRMVVELDALKRSRTVNAEIRWVRGSAIGVSFINPDDVYAKLLAR